MEPISTAASMLKMVRAFVPFIERSPALKFALGPWWPDSWETGIVLDVCVTYTGNGALTLDSCECILVDEDGELFTAYGTDCRKLGQGDAYTFVLFSPKLPFRINRVSVWDSTLKRWDARAADLLFLHVLLRRMGVSVDRWLAWPYRSAGLHFLAELKLEYLRRKEDWLSARSLARL